MPDGTAYLNIGEVARTLGVTRKTVYSMIRDGRLTAMPNPLDAREKLIDRAQVQELQKFARDTKNLAA